MRLKASFTLQANQSDRDEKAEKDSVGFVDSKENK